jgi:Bacteriophage Mu transposase
LTTAGVAPITFMTWLTLQELVELGVARQTINRRIKSGAWESRKGVRRSKGNGTRLREVNLKSLPQDLQVNYLRQFESEPLPEDLDGSLTTEHLYPADGVAAGKGPESPGEDGLQRLTDALKRYEPGVREAFQAEVLRLSLIVERFVSIKPRRVEAEPGKFDFVPMIRQLCNEAVCRDQIVLKVEPKRSKPPSPHTLELWAKSFKRDGLTAFLRKAHIPQSESDKRKAVISPKAAVDWLNSNCRKKPSPKALHREWAKQAKLHGWTIPSYGWVYRQYKDLPEIVRTMWFEGQKAYTGRLAPFLQRTVEDLTALQMLVGDHSVRDVMVMLPNGELIRPWLTLWQDLRTSLLWGWHLDITPSSNTIGLAYLDGVRNFGAQPLSNPDANFYSYLYTDQGKDYRCKTLTGQVLEFGKAGRIEGGLELVCKQLKVGFMNELGLKHFLARPYNAREKSIERTHRDISSWEQNTFEHEYCGKDTSHKPERFTAAVQRHQRLLKKAGKNLQWLSESPFMTLEDYRDNLAGFINEYNHSEHTRSVLGGSRIIPVQEYERLYTTRYEISEDALALLLMKVAKRKIKKNGVQMHQSHWFFWHDAMSMFKDGQEIEVRYTDGDYSRIWAVLPDGQVVEAPLITPSSILNPNKKSMEAMNRAKAHEKKVAREYQLIEQSNWRGETLEDRVAAEINPLDSEPPEEQRLAVNARPTVINLTRLDKPQLSSSGRASVTAEQVDRANVLDGMFGENRSSVRIKEEWED